MSACATASNPAAVHAVPTFDAARISQDIKTLSDDSFEGRGIATPAEDKVIRYLSEGYAAAGFEPGGPNGQWTQDVILNRFTQSNVRASLKLGDWTLPMTQGREVAISTRRPAEHVRTPRWSSSAMASMRPSGSGTTSRVRTCAARSWSCWSMTPTSRSQR